MQHVRISGASATSASDSVSVIELGHSWGPRQIFSFQNSALMFTFQFYFKKMGNNILLKGFQDVLHFGFQCCSFLRI